MESKESLVKKNFSDYYKSKNKTLDLSNIGLKKIPNNIPNDVMFLFLGNNKISNLDQIKDLKNLKVLDLSYNKLNNLENIPDSYEISCRNNNLTNINDLKKCKRLNKLDCSHNKIDNIPLIENLKILDCSNNLIYKLPFLPSINKIITERNNLEYINTYSNLI